MLFNSLDFALFFPAVFILYWFVTNKNLKAQNILIVISSLIFYGWWDWRFLSLLLFSALVDYFVGLSLQHENDLRKRKLLLCVSLFFNLGLLGFFKYYNFFAENFQQAFTFFGYHFNSQSLNLILPVGISFYTFQSLSYGIDVYRRKLEPTKDVVVFLAFVSFFPQLVAGPIERATNLLPQFYKKRFFDETKAIDGMRLILWGFFKKIVIADNCAPYVNDIFANYSNYSGATLIMGAVLFAFQIYCDFSGYSDIAIGLARLFGFDLMRNFRNPYFAKNMAEFWRRWHISLTTWFRDYVYLPLGGSRGNTIFKIRNVMIVFLVSGFWHGAKWTFIFWGLINALFFLPLLLGNANKKGAKDEKSLLPTLPELFQMLFTFSLVTFTWIFFRADSLDVAFLYINRIVSSPNFSEIHSALTFSTSIVPLLFYITFLFLIEWFGRHDEYVFNEYLVQKKTGVTILRHSLYFVILLIIIINIKNDASDFIYFQF